MNDSFRTEVFVRFQPETIACACIYLAARQLQVCSKYNIEFCTNYEFKAISEMDNKAHCKYMYVFRYFVPQIPLPNSPSWFSIFNVDESHIQEICLTILKLYARPKVSLCKYWDRFSLLKIS